MQYAHRASQRPRIRPWRKVIGSLIALLLVVGGGYILVRHHSTASDVLSPRTTVGTTQTSQQQPASDTKAKTITPVASAPNPCATNTLDKLALVSVGQRHMWACQQTTVVYSSAVVTGMENLAADLTPTGTYHIYGKETNLYLKGHDSTGSWNDYVNYWMPFLDNKYGAYGFHDATWRPTNAFGNISPYSSNASHGCVEMPLATAKWLYGWAVIGTTVTIES